MKLARLSIILLLFAVVYVPLRAQSQWPKSNYVVVGVFRILDNAVQYTNAANKNGFSAQYAIHPKYKFYYVYLLNNEDKMKAYIFMTKIRKETVYKDAWIFVGSLGTEDATTKVEPKTEPKVEVKEPVKEPPVVEPPPVKDSVKTVKKDTVVSLPKTDSSALKNPEVPIVAKKPKGKPFYFKVMSKDDGKELKGNLQLEEAEGATQFQAVKSSEIIYLEAPHNQKGAYTIIAQVPGYKERLLSFSYASPEGEKGSQEEDIITVTLEKSKKGGYIDFNNVRFLKNTSIMQPESQNELDGLVELLKENPKYKIKIYGYCNGKQARESTTLGTSTNFFALDNKTNKRGSLSSKALSLARAETTKAYLVQQGIDASRIGTKGEGGSVPLYPESGTQGQYNDRVEVEYSK